MFSTNLIKSHDKYRRKYQTIQGFMPIQPRVLNSATPTIFNLYDNQTANGRVEHLYNNLPEQLISQYQDQIQQLKEEVAFLRGLVGKQ